MYFCLESRLVLLFVLKYNFTVELFAGERGVQRGLYARTSLFIQYREYNNLVKRRGSTLSSSFLPKLGGLSAGALFLPNLLGIILVSLGTSCLLYWYLTSSSRKRRKTWIF